MALARGYVMARHSLVCGRAHSDAINERNKVFNHICVNNRVCLKI